MSRVGKKPIELPSGIKISVQPTNIQMESSKGKLSLSIPDGIKAEVKDNNLVVTRATDNKLHSMKHGLIRALLNNMVVGLSQGFTKELEIQGVGFKSELKGKKLVLNLGFSHPVEFNIPEGITIEVPKPTSIVIKGIDKQLVGEVAAEIRAFYKPEPYKGKGIRYVGEYVRKKAGKTVA
ncbi:MAG: 50S ribosomal protein L6 [Candidatus Omnitrophota bacterium]